MPAVDGWVARCRQGRSWFDVDVAAYVEKWHGRWPVAITDGVHVWESRHDQELPPPLRVVKNRVVLLYPFRRRVQCCDVVDVADALAWPLETRRR